MNNNGSDMEFGFSIENDVHVQTLFLKLGNFFIAQFGVINLQIFEFGKVLDG